jgi:hypothetical protein
MKRGNVQSRKCPARIVYERLVAGILMKIPNSSATKKENGNSGHLEKMERRITLSSFPGELTA